MENMIVLIGDVVASKELDKSEREQVQSALLTEFENINENSGSIVSPYTITLGDEFQALYRNASTLWQDCWAIMATLHPVRVRFSVSAGSIVTPVNEESAIGMDGPAFYNARSGIEALKSSGHLFGVQIEGAAENPEKQARVDLVNYSLQLLSGKMKSWKKIRYQVLVMLNRGMSVKNIAAELGISETAVYKNRDDGELELVMNLKRSIAKILNYEYVKGDTA